MEGKRRNIPIIMIEDETSSTSSSQHEENSDQEDRDNDQCLEQKPEASEADATDGINRSESYSMAIEGDEILPLLGNNNTVDTSVKKGRFTVSKPSDKGDLYSANIESVFQKMEAPQEERKKVKPNLMLDIAKANNKQTQGNVKFDYDDLLPETGLSVIDESNQRANRRSKLFTVINYGNVSTEDLPSTPSTAVSVTKPEFEKPLWPKDSLLPQGKSVFQSQGRPHRLERRRSSLHSNFKLGQIKPRIRLISGNHSLDVDDQIADDILSVASHNMKGSNFLLNKDGVGISYNDILSKQDKTFDSKTSGSNDIPDNKYAVETVRGSAQYMSKTLLDAARMGRLFAKRKTGRLLMKDGTFNITLKNIKTRHRKFIRDIFTTVLDMKWRWVIFAFFVAFIFSWLTFAALWYLIAFLHGDLKEPTETCVDGVNSFYTALLFSIETQHTIGYGTRAITAYCAPTVALFMLQSIFGVIVQCIMAGIVFAKLAKPKHRAETIMFSKNAVICKRDGEYCLLFRVADMRSSQLIGATLHAMFIKRTETREGEVIPFHQHHMEIKTESEEHDQFIFLAWPIRIVHHIDENSPLWDLSAAQMLAEDFEIIVVLEGCIESSGMTTQIRTSYLPSEILWGHAFAPFDTNRNGTSGKQEINFLTFNDTVPNDIPTCSAKDYYLGY